MLRSLDVNVIDDKYDYKINLEKDPTLRIKMGKGKQKGFDESLLPEELGDDHWGEINNF